MILSNFTTIDLTKANLKDPSSVYDFLSAKGIKGNNHLLSGAPTSQILLYLVNYEMFNEMQALADKHLVLMTIYVDDITFSSTHKISHRFQEQIIRIIKKYKYQVSRNKVKYYTKMYPKLITGVILSANGKVAIKNSLRKKIIADHKCLRNNPDDLTSRKRLQGLVTAARQIQKDAYPSIYAFAFKKRKEQKRSETQCIGKGKSMNLLSDKIYNYQVKHVLSQELIKTSQEYYVLAVLKYAFPERFSGLQKSETPDLQDVKKSLGVEVTWGDSHISGIISGESYKYTQANTQADKEKCLKKIRKNGGDRNLVLTSYPLSTAEGSLTCIQKAFQNKKSKIEKYRQNVQCIGLAMIIDIPIIIISDYHWEESLTNQNNNGFDFAVLVHWSGVDLYDFNTKKYIFKMISKQEMLTLKKIGRLTAEGIITVEDDVWI